MTDSSRSETNDRAGRWRLAAWGLGAFLLLLPLLAMQVTEQVAWTGSDFAFAAVLIFSALGAYEVAARRTAVAAGPRRTWYRAGVALGIGATFLLFWGNGAVSVTDSPADLYYYVAGLLGIGVVVVSLTRPAAGAVGMVGVALALVLAAAVTLLTGRVPNPFVPVSELLVITGFYGALYAAAAWLLRESTRALPPGDDPA